MRTSHHYSVSSAGRLSTWLVAILGLGAYVGLIYGLTVFPLQLELPVPHWATFAVPAVAYALLILLFVRRPTILRWLIGTAILSGLHLALAMAREPLSVMLDPALAGRPLPWTLPPPLPEVVGVCLLLVPLRDVLRARPRLARERTSSSTRAASSLRARGSVVPRVPQAAAPEGMESPKEVPVWERSAAAQPIEAPAPMPARAPRTPAEPVRLPPRPDEASRPAAPRVERRPEPARTQVRRTDVVLRIALDRIMGQLPPGTFLAPEEEVAASLREPGHLLIPGDLVVTQLSEGVARIDWNDIVDQFPAHLVGLGPDEIREHLGEGVRLPLDEVVGQLPHELFVADTPEMEIAGLDRIPVPFQPMEDSTPAPSLSQTAKADVSPVPDGVQPGPAAPADSPAQSAAARASAQGRHDEPEPFTAGAASASAVPVQVPPPSPSTPPPSPAAPAREQVGRVPSQAARAPEPPAVVSSPSSPEAEGPTVRISFARLASELPPDAFNVGLDQVAERMRQPGVLLIPHELVLSQLAEGLVRVQWDAIASQFPRETLAVSDADMMARLPHGLALPLDEVIGQIPAQIFAIAAAAVDLHSLESFPAPFQPVLSDPVPDRPAADRAEPPAVPAGTAPAAEPESAVAPSPVNSPPPVEREATPEVASEMVIAGLESPSLAEPAVDRVPVEVPRDNSTLRSEHVPVVQALIPEPVDSTVPEFPEPPAPGPEPEMRPVEEVGAIAAEPVVAQSPAVGVELPRVDQGWPDTESATPTVGVPVTGDKEASEARRISAMLAPIASFDVSIQAVEGVTVFAMAAPRVAAEIVVAGAGLALPLLTEHRAWPIDQITFRGPETALVITALGTAGDGGSVLAAAVPRGGGLALLEILCRRAAGDGNGLIPTPNGHSVSMSRGLIPSSAERFSGLASSLTAFGEVTASALRDAGGEGLVYLFMPAGMDASGVGALAHDVQGVMRKTAGSGAVFRTAVLRAGSRLLVIHPEEVAHGGSVMVVAGGQVSRPGLAYRQVERVIAALAQA